MKPETDEAVRAEGILMGAGSHIVQYARLGEDILGIYQTFIKGKEVYQN